MKYLSVIIACLICIACAKTERVNSTKNTVFKRLSASETQIEFSNNLEDEEGFSVFQYRNFYNGGGVAIADFDNDGLADVYLTANVAGNKLFRNLGGWKFEDITVSAGVSGSKEWSTGVSVADVNADGWLDIYVCNAGDIEGGHRENELFINNGNLTFTERAAEYGLNDNGFSTHAVFFDFDRDHDLDCYLLNNSPRTVSSLGYRNLRHVRDSLGGHKLYRNDDGKFHDISEKAGIYSSVIGFGLGASVGDVNQDGWLDLYISNDLYERDYLYINNQKGGFDERLEELMGHISMFSMGSDLADINNDGFPEIFSTDMLPEKYDRLKTMVAFEAYDVYQLRLKNGYYHQYMRNMLHLNNGQGKFLDIGELAGVASTDWSWGALITDFNNDGYKEIFVSNGIYKDFIDQDFVENLSRNEEIKKLALEGKQVDFRTYLEDIPSTKMQNFLFERKSDLQFENHSAQYGLDDPSFSNGAAYGDLDNDGDLDLIVNNVNQELFVYQNQTAEQKQYHSLTIAFKGNAKNTFGIGTVIKAIVRDQTLLFTHMPNRGFQSSMDYKMVIGLGAADTIDSLIIQWPDQKVQTLTNLKSKQILADYSNAKWISNPIPQNKPLLNRITDQSIVHTENKFNDFDRDRLQYHSLSTQGPAFAQADLNGDLLDDVFVGGSVGSSSKIYLQNAAGKFIMTDSKVFDTDSLSEDTGAAFFDADGDGDKDLYVVTGGSEYTGESEFLLDRFYINNGTLSKPEFKKKDSSIPAMMQSGSCVRPADFDKDGDLDLFVGTRVIPGKYGLPAGQFLLQNDGKGNFQDIAAQWAPELKKFGMVTNASWIDLDKDGFLDLIIVGEWMPITAYKNTGTQLVMVTDIPSLSRSDGWWNVIHPVDIDNDSDMDFVVGNLGLNTKFKPSLESPLRLYVNDFDQNGSQEPIFTFMRDGREFPMAQRPDIIKQMSSMRKQFVLYRDYANLPLSDMLDEDLIGKSVQLKFCQPQTSLLINNGNFSFELRPLPLQAQLAPVFGMATLDLNHDSHADIVLGGNLFAVKPEAGRYDALHGLVLLGNGKGNFEPLMASRSGLDLEGEVRHIAVLNNGREKFLGFIRNNNTAVIYSINK